jgi:hypothetical protein
MKMHRLLRVTRRGLQTAVGSEQRTSLQRDASAFSLAFWRENGLAITSFMALFGAVALASGMVVSLQKDIQKERELREKDVQKERELWQKDVQKERELRLKDVQNERELREKDCQLAIVTASASSRVGDPKLSLRPCLRSTSGECISMQLT